MKHKLLPRVMMGAIALTAVTACSDDVAEEAPTPTINRFVLDGNAVPVGGTVNITWDVTNAERIEISQTGYEGSPLTSTELTGMLASNPINEDTTFVLTAFNQDKQAMSDARMVVAEGIRIAAFGVSPEAIEVGSSATLNWRITGGTPSSVTITDGANTEIYSGTEAIGSTDVSPEVTTTYTLETVGDTVQRATTTLTVNVNTLPPAIDSFIAIPENVVQDQQLTDLRWQTTNADEVMILTNINGVRRVIRPYIDIGIPDGNFRSLLSDPSVNFVLHARNNTTTIATATVTVNAQVGPSITALTVDPLGYTQASTVATVRWDTENTETVSLRLNDAAVPGFPATSTAGTFQLSVVGQATLTLRASNAVSFAEASVTVAETFDEPEPNNNTAQAIPIVADGVPVRGTISDATDLDWYRFEITEADSWLFVQAGWTRAGGCGFDSIIRLYDASGTIIGVQDDAVWAEVEPCGQIHPAAVDFARGLAAGTYYVSVGGTGNQPTGVYNLSVSAQGPRANDLVPGAMITPVGAPDWGIVDMHLFSIDVGLDITTLITSVNRIMQPFHAVDGLFADSFLPVLSHVQSHQIPYRRELQSYLQANGIESKTVFSAAELNQTNAVVLGYTIVPTSTTTGGTSPDFTNFPSLIIPHSRFPITTQVQVFRNNTSWQGPEAPVGYPGYDQWPTGGAVGPPAFIGQGSSHRHFLHPASQQYGGNPPGPGDYTFQISLSDGNLAGYVLQVPFTVQ